MKQMIVILIFVISTLMTFGQDIPQEYFDLVKKADSLYYAKDFKNSAYKYSDAFKANGWKGLPRHEYNAACSWALIATSDSAFFRLSNIAKTANYTDYDHITKDTHLNSLHNDSRWDPLLAIIKQNKEKAEINFNKPLIAILDSIFKEDQKYRGQLKKIKKQYGWDSKEIKDQWKIINEKDSINLIKIKSIIDEYGWLGSDVISERGNTTLFLVIQHSDQTTQEKYLPILREAVQNGKAQGGDLALLEDRVALGQGKRQVYGSQIGQDPDTQTYYISPLEDPENVDKRRTEVGLEPLAEYVSMWNIKWDIEQYKKDLPKLEEKLNLK